MKRLIDANELDDSLGISDEDINFHYMLEEAETVLTIPENPTNGDMIKALFPDIEIADCTKLDKIYTGIPFGKLIGANRDCMRDWWNAPWKENK